jgi:hypothetical protein
MPSLGGTVDTLLAIGADEESGMKFRWVGIAVAAAAVIAADPALARVRHKARPHCIDRPYEFSWSGFWFNPPPEWNGCSPPVYVDGEFVGQDPDANIRFQLRRDPATGNLYGRY